MKYEITIDGVTRSVDISVRKDGRYEIGWDGTTRLVDLVRPTPEAFQMLIDGESWEAGAVRSESGWLVDVMGFSTQVDVVDPRRKALRLGVSAAGGMIATQMPGRVVRVLAPVGTVVKKGQPVLVVEAMKMENELKAPMDGTVVDVMVVEGQTVETGTKLARVE